ncbi:hypothetical protein VTJ04DRAFT_7927 [Mycothermus thermophilus]|uniref:uncharacterized protein n=1 Tax=Humicola insolens TaxID=85995 RepID=UPI003742840F
MDCHQYLLPTARRRRRRRRLLNAGADFPFPWHFAGGGGDAQRLLRSLASRRKQTLLDYMTDIPPRRVIIFAISARTVEELDDLLYKNKFPCTSIHAFRSGEYPICLPGRPLCHGGLPSVSSSHGSGRRSLRHEDGGASLRRGQPDDTSIDAHNVTHVINYDSAAGSPPQSPLLRAASSVSEQRLCNVSVDDVFQVINYGLPG